MIARTLSNVSSCQRIACDGRLPRATSPFLPAIDRGDRLFFRGHRRQRRRRALAVGSAVPKGILTVSVPVTEIAAPQGKRVTVTSAA
ncbi:hypothetical protein APR08_006272 [Nocardia amikacinitolerans]|nr:hypothetical protein [Nocardia amikacinitolerans]